MFIYVNSTNLVEWLLVRTYGDGRVKRLPKYRRTTTSSSGFTRSFSIHGVPKPREGTQTRGMPARSIHRLIVRGEIRHAAARRLSGYTVWPLTMNGKEYPVSASSCFRIHRTPRRTPPC